MNSTPLEAKLAEIKKLCEASTKPPWKWELSFGGWKALNAEGRVDSKDSSQLRVLYVRNDGLAGMNHTDAQFIAASRELVPKLVQALEYAIKPLKLPLFVREAIEIDGVTGTADCEIDGEAMLRRILTILTGSKLEEFAN